MDLSSLSTVQLRDLLQRIPAELQRREAQEKAALLDELRALARARGYSMEEIVGKEAAAPAPRSTAGSKVRVKYRHPRQPDLAWTGRGRMPKWVEAWLADGGSLEQLLV